MSYEKREETTSLLNGLKNVLYKNKIIMKNYIVSILLLTLLLSVSSCNKDYTDNIITSSVSSEIEKAKLKILTLGLDTANLGEYGEYYVVENDILIHKDSLFDSPMTRQYHTTYTVDNAITITIGADETITPSSGWKEAIAEVIKIYNEYTGLYFMYSEVAPTIKVTKKMIGTIYTCAQGEFPSGSGRPGANIYINTQFFQNIDTFLSHSQKVFLLMHELGHNLGLRHTDCAINGEGISSYGMVQIPGTPDTDSSSYMNSSTCGHNWTEMPKYDKIALAYLFPPISYYTVHFENCTNVSDINFSKTEGYFLDRRIIPTKEGYSFAGWHHAPEGFYAPCRYDYKITSNKTVYAHWNPLKNTTITTYFSSHSFAGNSSTYNMNNVCPVFITIRVYKGENSWKDIMQYNDTYFEMSGSSLSEYKVNMEPFMNVPEDVAYVEYTDRIVLDEGTYRFQSKFTTKLGEQRETGGKRGYMYTIVESDHK